MQFPFSNYSTFSVAMFVTAIPLHVESVSVIAKIFTQVHDELVLEVDPSVIKEAAALLQKSMENAASLLGKINMQPPLHFSFFCIQNVYHKIFKCDSFQFLCKSN